MSSRAGAAGPSGSAGRTPARLRGLTPHELDEDQRRVYESIAGGDRAKDASFPLTEADGSLVGPFNALLYSPDVGDAIQQVGTAIRFHCSLSSRIREIAVLSVAAHWRSPFEWWAHEPIGRRAGLGDDEIAALHAGADPAFDDPTDEAAHALCQAVLATGGSDDETYARAHALLGDQGTFELVALVGYYSLLAMTMQVFEIGVPEGEQSPFT